MGRQSSLEVLESITEEDFDFSGPEVNAVIRYQGEVIGESVSMPLDLTGEEVVDEAQLYGIPRGDEYALYLKNPNSGGEFVFCPPGKTLADFCDSIGLDVSAELQFEIMPEYKGA